jgi:hypothetical protein
MEHLKMLGLAVIAALGLLALVGVGTASATRLCTDSACNTVYPTGTSFHATLVPETSSTGKSGSVTISTCTESTASGNTQNETGASIVISGVNIQTGSCSQTTHTLAAGSLSIMRTGLNTGEVIAKGNAVTQGIFGTSCTYGTGEGVKLGTFTGGSPAVMKINALLPRIAGGFLCPSPATWTAEYVVTSPHALYVGA